MTKAPGTSSSLAVASTTAWSAAWSIGLSADEPFVVPPRSSSCWAKVETTTPMANQMASRTRSFMIYSATLVYLLSFRDSRTQFSATAVPCLAIRQQSPFLSLQETCDMVRVAILRLGGGVFQRQARITIMLIIRCIVAQCQGLSTYDIGNEPLGRG
jgi:hypothetical protein